jgi:hypothetical protein
MTWTVRAAQARLRSGLFAALLLTIGAGCSQDVLTAPLKSPGALHGGDVDGGNGLRSLCQPCQASQQCQGASVCAAMGKPAGSQGFFCVYSCAGGATCPGGYHCDTASNSDGKPNDVCIPDGDLCGCTTDSAGEGLTTPCFRVAYDESGAPVGKCTGTWSCGQDGGVCDAAMPATETCNGKDDDCDGQTDEGASCDDGDPCTIDSCGAGKCQASAGTCGCQSDAECPTTNPCLGKRFCDKSKTVAVCALVPGTQVQCDTSQDGPCGQHACDPSSGQCVLSGGKADGTPCDADANACTQGDACLAGACVAGKAVGCDDGNPCTADSCVAASGCQHVAADGGPCDLDGSACTADACLGGKCTAGKQGGCDDGNACTEDKCDSATGQCSHDITTLAGKACDDGNGCTDGDACKAGGCTGSAKVCDDGNPCTDDSCDGKACVNKPNSAPCSDSDLCTSPDVCEGGACKGGPGVCECKTDADCAKAGVNACLGKLTCAGNKCAVVPGSAVVCDPAGNGACSTDACNPATGQCAPVLQADGKACDDGNACTSLDACATGKCAGKAVGCDDGNPCTDDSCDPKVGCKHAANAAPCDADGNGCTGPDACSGGACKPGAAKVCDDGNPCTVDGCDAKTGSCTQDGAALEGKSCTGTACGASSCAGGQCVAAKQNPCDDGNPCTDDSCDGSKGCKHAANAAPCDDANLCTTGDVCAAGSCKPGAAAQCDDGNPCTDDDCAKVLGCLHTNNTAPCDDVDACTTGDACKDGKCAGMPKSCDDGNPCSLDVCSGGKCSSDIAAQVGKACTPPPNCKGPGACSTSGKCKVPDGACSGAELWPPIVPAKFGPAGQLFDPVGYHVVQITLSASAWKQYLADVSAASANSPWYPADVTIDGIAYTGVGIRKFGYGSMLNNPQKPNVRIGFDQYNAAKTGPEAEKNLRLKASGQDRTFLRQPLAQVLTQQLGGFAPRFGWARVMVNGENYGLYQLFEQADKRMFSTNFGNNDGDKYESINGCVGLNCPGGDCNAVKYDYAASPGTGSQLVALAKAAHNGTDSAWPDQAAGVADWDALLAYYAVESVLSDLDGLTAAGQNFTVYAHEVTKLLEFIPTGADLTFGNFGSWYDLFQPWGAPNTWCKDRTDEFYTRLMKTPATKAKMTGLWQQLQCGAMANGKVVPLIDQYKAMLKQDLYYDPKGQATQAEIDAEFSQIKQYIVNRNGAIANLLGACP